MKYSGIRIANAAAAVKNRPVIMSPRSEFLNHDTTNLAEMQELCRSACLTLGCMASKRKDGGGTPQKHAGNTMRVIAANGARMRDMPKSWLTSYEN